MAASKTTKGKKTSTSQNSEQKRRNEILENEKRKRHIWSVILFAVGILFLVFSFVGSIDTGEPNLGDYIHRLFFGLFGVSTFLVGPLVIYIAINLASDKCKTTLAIKLIQMGLLFVIITAAIQIIFFGEIRADNFFGVVGQTYNNGKMLKSSGVLGLILGLPLLLFGEIAARIIIILIIFVIIMITMNISLISFLRILLMPFTKLIKGTNKIILNQKEEQRIIKEERFRYTEDEIYDEYDDEKIVVNTHVEPKKYISPDNEKNDILLEIERAKKFSSIESATNSVRNLNQNETNNYEKIQPVYESPNSTLSDSEISQSSEPSIISPYFPDKGESIDDEEIALIFNRPQEEESLSENISINSDDEHINRKNAVIEAIDAFSEEEGIDVAATADKINPEIIKDEKVLDDVDSKEVIEELALKYTLPPVMLLNDIVEDRNPKDIETELQTNATTLTETLKSFGVQTKIVGICRGPSVTRYEIQPAAGVKISKITNLVDDISLNLASAGVRIEAPIPNKAAVGIEVPNKQVDTVPFRSLVDSDTFRETKSKLGTVIGKNISGEIIVADIAKMPHTLIAGTTGSGKSVCVNSIIMSILFRSTPDEVRLLMIDPKAVEFMIYNGIPHLLIPVVTDPKKAAGALGWAVTEMLNRYKMFSDNNVRDLTGFNSLAKGNPDIKPMPQIVIFIDELADLMMASPGEVEDSICRLAQMARAAGMHLVIATQRPSVNVVTGVIKANIPSRIALKVASQVDSRTIIDSAGAEKLLGKGDMLYYPVGAPKPMRVQGCWVSDKEVDRVVNFIKNSFTLDYDESVIEEIDRQAELSATNEKGGKSSQSGDIDSSDEKLEEAIQAVVEAGQASTSYLQRKLKLGYGRAARLIDIMEEMGIVGPFEGSKPRQIILTKQEWLERKLNEK